MEKPPLQQGGSGWGAATTERANVSRARRHASIAAGTAFFLLFYFRLIVQDHAEQRTVDFHFAVVADESQSPEFVHEEAHPRPGCPDHVCERLLADLGDDGLGFALLAEIRQQQKGPRQTFF